jgi:AraC-like DNA-binding protein
MRRKPREMDAMQATAERKRAELARWMADRLNSDGVHPTAINSLSLIRASRVLRPTPDVCQPSLCFVVQGEKQALLGTEVHAYGALRYLVVSMTLPVVWKLVEATPERPYLCIRIDVDTATVEQLHLQMHACQPLAPSQQRTLYVAHADAALLDSVGRLVSLLDAPQDLAILAPLVLREIHYRVLVGELGHRLRALCAPGSPSQRVARAIHLLKTQYTQPLQIGKLASAANMSRSALYAHFTQATAMSPLQFQKQLRLQEARRLMLIEALGAASAGYRVGYNSPSQFSRDYRGLFGLSPTRDIAAARQGLAR